MSINITPKLGEHAALVGRTGSGKTRLAVPILQRMASRHPVIAIDTKGDSQLEKLPGPVIETPKEALSYPGTYIYRPEGWANEPEALDAFLHRLYEQRRSIVVYVDEAYQVVPNGLRPGPGLSNLLMRGRYRRRGSESPVRMTTITGSQRPAWVPRHVFTEATRFYVFDLTDDDLKKMVGYTGEPVLLKDPAAGHDFWYYNAGNRDIRKLRMKEGL